MKALTRENSALIRLLIAADGAPKVLRLVEALEDLDDVQRVSSNFEIPDALMAELSVDFEEFGWASNKGYGSAEHMRLIAELGPTAHHRVTWVKK